MITEEQLIGALERAYPGKKDCVDFWVGTEVDPQTRQPLGGPGLMDWSVDDNPPTDFEKIVRDNPPSLDEVKADKKAALQAAYEAATVAPQTFATETNETAPFVADPGTVQKLQQMLMAYQKSKRVPDGFYFRAADGAKLPMTYDDLENLAETLGGHGQAQWFKLDQLRDAVDEAETVEAVEAVSWGD